MCYYYLQKFLESLGVLLIFTKSWEFLRSRFLSFLSVSALKTAKKVLHFFWNLQFLRNSLRCARVIYKNLRILQGVQELRGGNLIVTLRYISCRLWRALRIKSILLLFLKLPQWNLVQKKQRSVTPRSSDSDTSTGFPEN